MRAVVVVGASLAGLSAVEELRASGFDGRVTVVGDEPHPPYDRPPLSKQVLTGAWGVERTALRPPDDLDDLRVDWVLGTRAAALDLAGRTVTLADGHRVGFDGLVIATGARPRRLPGTDHVPGVHVLRTLDDCLALRAELEAGPRRVVVVGAGFIGAEVAASCRARDLPVTVLEALPVPLARVLGDDLGQMVADLHRDHGVDLRCGVTVAAFEGDGGDGRVAAVRLGDGSVVEADVVVVGIGVAPDTGWLEGSGLALADGVVVDETCLAAPGVVAAGDVARWPHPRTGQLVRVEHWDHAVDQGRAAARRLLGKLERFAPVPWFWSDQYDRKFQVTGWWDPAGEIRVVDGSVAERRFVAVCGKDGLVIGALAVNRPRLVAGYRMRLESPLPWDDPAATDPAALFA